MNQPVLTAQEPSIAPSRSVREDNKLRLEDRAAHNWYRFVLSFPAHLVRTHLGRFDLRPGQNVLDPFCGTGTTLVECRKPGISSCGIEPNPVAAFASRTKLDWEVNPDELVAHASHVAELTLRKFSGQGFEDQENLPLFGRRQAWPVRLKTLPSAVSKLLLTDSISPLPFHKTILLLETLEENKESRLLAHEHLALAKALINEISNLQFGPEIGVGPKKSDAAVVAPWRLGVKK